MARKGRTQGYTAALGGQRPQANGARQRRRMKFLAGGIILVLVLGLGAWIRWRQQRDVVTQLQNTGASRYPRGPAGAPVIIKEFSDYTCPHCKMLQEPLEHVLQRFEGQVQLLLYPYVLNPTSEVATHMAWCAGEQGKFWEFHHMLYRRQGIWYRLTAPQERLLEFAQDLHLDTAMLKSCVESKRMQERINMDKAYGQQLQVNSTPTLFVNEQRVVGSKPENELVQLVQQELERVQQRAK
ncbi:MAG: DsbA family protein [Candidatus Tectimicrobiota bacterium]